MKKLLSLLLLTLILASCKKGDTTPATPKKVERLVIGPEIPVQLKGREFYIGVQYTKDYSTSDKVTLTLNDQPGAVISSGYAELEGWHVLFKFPAVNQAGTVKIKATVTNDQQSTVASIDYKILNDLNLSTVWENLSKTYILGIPADLSRRNNGEFSMPLRIVYLNGVPSEPLLVGAFTDDHDADNSYRAPRVFIPGLEGYYALTYSGDALSKIRVNHAQNLNSAPNFTGQKFYDELRSVFGTPVSVKNTPTEVVNTYNYPGFTVETHLDKEAMYTLITKN